MCCCERGEDCGRDTILFDIFMKLFRNLHKILLFVAMVIAIGTYIQPSIAKALAPTSFCIVFQSCTSTTSAMAVLPITATSTTEQQAPSVATSTADHYTPPARSKKFGCVATNGLPDPVCSPGAVFADVTVSQICVSGYSSSVRNVPTSEKDAVFAEYGIASHTAGEYEVDHIISLELGGSNDIANLFPEAAEPKPGFHEKDKVENYLHALVCNGTMKLEEAQRRIATDWLGVYGEMGK